MRKLTHSVSYDDRAWPAMSLRLLLSQTRRNATRRGIYFALSIEDVMKMYREGSGRCAISAIRFNKTLKIGRCRPYAPSIDRIDSAKGYTFSNCRLVCTAVNLAINDFGLEVLENIAVGMARHVKFNARVWR